MPARPRWLDDDQRRAWMAYVDLSTLLEDHLNRQLRRDAGVTHFDYTVLSHLSSAPRRTLSMSDLAQRLKITRSRLTHAVTRLEAAGFVERRGDPDDGRVQLAALTSAGFDLLRKAAPGHVEAVRRAVFDALTTDQIRQLADIAETIIDSIQHDDGDSTTLPWRRR